jgi:hypothetical protein
LSVVIILLASSQLPFFHQYVKEFFYCANVLTRSWVYLLEKFVYAKRALAFVLNQALATWRKMRLSEGQSSVVFFLSHPFSMACVLSLFIVTMESVYLVQVCVCVCLCVCVCACVCVCVCVCACVCVCTHMITYT